jgi:hypothetical protein
MEKSLLRKLIRSKVFVGLLIGAILYFIGLTIYLTAILPNRIQLNEFQRISDLFHIIYWRWWLDWGIVIGYTLILSSLLVIFKIMEKWIKCRKLARYILPVMLMTVNFIGMVALDIAITFFADVYKNGDWLSQEIVWGGLTAQRIYHLFFFWIMPSLLIIGYPVHNFILSTDERYSSTFKMFFLFMACYDITLGILDPIVCQSLWGDWKIFGEWDMGTGAMFASGWIAHYIIFSIFWMLAIKVVNLVKNQVDYIENNQDP